MTIELKNIIKMLEQYYEEHEHECSRILFTSYGKVNGVDAPENLVFVKGSPRFLGRDSRVLAQWITEKAVACTKQNKKVVHHIIQNGICLENGR